VIVGDIRTMPPADKDKKSMWDGYKDVFLKCEGRDVCDVWQVVRVKEGWNPKKEGKFVCGICLRMLVAENEKEVEHWKKRAEKAEKALDRLEKEWKKDEKKEEKMKEERKTYAEKLGEQLRLHKEELEMKHVEAESKMKEDLTKELYDEVKRNQRDEARKKRMMVFGLKESWVGDEAQVQEMLDRVAAPMKINPVKIERLRVKENGVNSQRKKEVCRPIVVEFRSETEKWQVLGKKSNLRKDREFKRVFLEMDLPWEMREAEKKKKWERRQAAKKIRWEQEGSQSNKTPETRESEMERRETNGEKEEKGKKDGPTEQQPAESADMKVEESTTVEEEMTEEEEEDITQLKTLVKKRTQRNEGV
jgi:hypothetical protein